MQNRSLMEIALIDADQEKAEGEAMDMAMGFRWWGNMKILRRQL